MDLDPGLSTKFKYANAVYSRAITYIIIQIYQYKLQTLNLKCIMQYIYHISSNLMSGRGQYIFPITTPTPTSFAVSRLTTALEWFIYKRWGIGTCTNLNNFCYTGPNMAIYNLFISVISKNF